MFRAAPGPAPFSLTVLSMLPALLLLLPPINPGIMLDIGRRLRRGAAVLVGVWVMPKALLSLEAAPKVDFSLSAFSYASLSLFFLPRNHRRRAAMIPTIAIIPIARPAFAPVDIPPSLELEVGESAEDEVAAAPAIAVLDDRLEVEAEVLSVVLRPKSFEKAALSEGDVETAPVGLDSAEA